jgi:hypothetical protein
MSQSNLCQHGAVACLNQHELIRKYRCTDCGEVMMCCCDEAFGRRFLAHQLVEGCELETQLRVPVTIAFQPNICNGCRGLALEPAPAAAGLGRTSKIKRFYWRELFFRETEAVADWDASHPDVADEDVRSTHKRIEREILDEIKQLHAAAPLYDMTAPSQADILDRCQVDIESFYPDYAASPEKGAVVLVEGETVSPETFVSRHYQRLGWSVLELESRPLHALFAVMMWLLIEDGADPQNRIVTFGSRTAFDARVPGEMIWTHLPDDFGTPGYGRRRKAAVDEHFSFFFEPDGHVDTGDLLWLFDYWRFHSARLREYLWAHQDRDVDRARQLIEIFPPGAILVILRYLVDDYWGRYLGWPDLLLWRDDEILLIEVKSSSDRLSGDQMRWIVDNFEQLKLPFRVAKLHRPSRQNRRSTGSNPSPGQS